MTCGRRWLVTPAAVARQDRSGTCESRVRSGASEPLQQVCLRRRARLVRRRTGVSAAGPGLAVAGCRVGTHMLSNPHAPNKAAACSGALAFAPAPVSSGTAALWAAALAVAAVVRFATADAQSAAAGMRVGGETLGGGAVNAAKMAGATFGTAGTGGALAPAPSFITGASGAGAVFAAASASICAAALSSAMCSALA